MYIYIYIYILFFVYKNLVTNRQIAQLDQVLQRTSNTPENRYSLSGENTKKYDDVEVPDHIQKCTYSYVVYIYKQIIEFIFLIFI